MTRPPLDLTLDDDQDHSVLIDRLPEPDTSYPVLIEYTQRRVAWVDAESQEDAYRQVLDVAYEYWDGAEETDDGNSMGIIAPADYYPDRRWFEKPDVDPEAYIAARQTSELGPQEGCACGGSTFGSIHARAWIYVHHKPECPRHRHHIGIDSVYRRGGHGEVVGYLPWCFCGNPSLARTPGFSYAEGNPPMVSLEVARARLLAHVIGRAHTDVHGLIPEVTVVDLGFSRYPRSVASA